MFQLVAVFLICLVETEIFLLMRQNIENYRGDFQFPHTLASRLLRGGGGAINSCLLLVFRQSRQKLFPLLTVCAGD